MKTIKYFSLFILCTITIIFASCGNKTNNPQVDASAYVDSALVFITNEQFNAMGMELGTLQTIPFRETLQVNGNIVSSTKGEAQITSRIAGTVKSIINELGDYVQQGATLLTVESNEIVSLQQEFVNIAARYSEVKSAFERAASLYSDSIIAKKDFIAAESNYKSLQAQYQGVKQQLNLLHINPDNVLNGKFQSSINIVSPINGYITQRNCMLGEYVTPDKNLMSVVNNNRAFLQLNVFEKDITKLTDGEKVQVVEFYNHNNPEVKYKAHISKIGRAIDPELRTIPCVAVIDQPDLTHFVNNMYVEAEIIISERQAKGLPEEAFIVIGNSQRIYILEKQDDNGLYFRPTTVKTGMTSDNYTEILSTIPEREILVKGVYNLPSE